jgi:hypothetical protein
LHPFFIDLYQLRFMVYGRENGEKPLLPRNCERQLFSLNSAVPEIGERLQEGLR